MTQMPMHGNMYYNLTPEFELCVRVGVGDDGTSWFCFDYDDRCEDVWAKGATNAGVQSKLTTSRFDVDLTSEKPTRDK
jgi:hypothetical protein